MRRRYIDISLSAVALVLLVLAPGPLRAQSMDSHFFRPALFAGGIFAVDTAGSPRKWQPSFRFFFHHEGAPLKLTFPDDKARCSVGRCLGTLDIIDHAQVFHLQAQMGLTRWLELALDIPLVRHTLNDQGFGLLQSTARTNVSTPSVSPLDARVGLKLRLLDAAGFALGVSLDGTLPFGDEEVLAGEQGFTLQPRLLASFKRGRLLVGVNVGYRIREENVMWWDDPETKATTAVPLLALDDEVTYGVGATLRFHPMLAVGAEVYGAIPVGDKLQTLTSESVTYPGSSTCPASKTQPCVKVTSRELEVPAEPVTEVLAGLIISPTPSLDITVGAGLGVTGEQRQSAVRLFLGLAWAPGVASRVVDPADLDGDGIPGDIDACPRQAEDKDGYQDQDGCPEPDNDDDGVLDHKDACPLLAEDEDGHEDSDGCPDLDNDGDKVPDNRDGCPGVAEDKDGHEDGDGCPDLDNDEDGIPDDRDRCPDEPETKNKFQDGDGCPDTLPGGGNR